MTVGNPQAHPSLTPSLSLCRCRAPFTIQPALERIYHIPSSLAVVVGVSKHCTQVCLYSMRGTQRGSWEEALLCTVLPCVSTESHVVVIDTQAQTPIRKRIDSYIKSIMEFNGIVGVLTSSGYPITALRTLCLQHINENSVGTQRKNTCMPCLWSGMLSITQYSLRNHRQE